MLKKILSSKMFFTCYILNLTFVIGVKDSIFLFCYMREGLQSFSFFSEQSRYRKPELFEVQSFSKLVTACDSSLTNRKLFIFICNL